MNLPDLYDALVLAMLVLAPVVFVVLFYISAPYGRFTRAGWGPTLNNRVGWFVMEAPVSLVVAFIMLFLVELNTVTWVFFFMWQLHYFHRAFIYPFSLRASRSMPIVIALMAILFNSINAYLIGFHFVLNSYEFEWLTSPFFILGSILYGTGYVVTKRSDTILRSLRTPGYKSYKVPHGFLYRYVSCPNYLGEIIQWAGWAILTWSMAGLVFLVWTIANLAPRAIAHHKWYGETFPDYPSERKALLPFIF